MAETDFDIDSVCDDGIARFVESVWATVGSWILGAAAILLLALIFAELAPMIPSALYPLIFDYPIFAQKASALLTDAFRCELLSACGYTVKASEFVDPDHTPKNILLKAVRNGKRRPLHPDFCELRQHLPSGILLERLLSEKGLV